jgi:hypothetical protein
MLNDYTGTEDEYDPFTHMYPILIGAEDEGFYEIVLVFVILKGGEEIDQLKTAIPLEPDDHVNLPDEAGPRFEIPDDFFSGEAKVVNDGLWIIPAIINARKLIGPPSDNIPGGESGESVSPRELAEIMTSINFSEVFTQFRETILCSKYAPKRLIDIIDRFIAKYES